MKTELISEVWKPVPNYEGLYDVSNFGRVRSLYRYKVILKPQLQKGYCYVDLCKDGKKKRYSIHRLVWETFNSSIPEDYEINHIDENPLNNCISNLSAVSHKTNINWGTRNKKVSVAMTNGKESKKVGQCTPNGELVHVWPSTAEAGRNGYNQGNVAACCRGVKPQYKGFIWIYL